MNTAACVICCAVITMITPNYAQKFDDVIDNYKSIIEDTSHECTDESGVNPKLMDDLLHKGIYVEDRKLKCYLRCTYLKLGIINPNGHVDENVLKLTAGTTDQNILEAVVNNCKNISGNDLCEKSFNLSKCTYNTVHSFH
ncbi:hypothetical protein FQR65_LT02006 [Abscondita terminalis]|nr:hypothetical protein FQR65_LT02006 [Abscondita terminalis]